MTTRRSIFKTFAAAVCASAADVLGLQPIPRFRAVFEAAYSAKAPRMQVFEDEFATYFSFSSEFCQLPHPKQPSVSMDEPRFNLVDGEWQLASPPPNDCQPNPDYYTP